MYGLGIFACIIGAIFIIICLYWICKRAEFKDKLDFKARTITFSIIALVFLGLGVYCIKEDSYTPSDYSDYSYTSSVKSTKSSHDCYICGEDADLKYGSHYYCDYHWAMVKTVDEAQ